MKVAMQARAGLALQRIGLATAILVIGTMAGVLYPEAVDAQDNALDCDQQFVALSGGVVSVSPGSAEDAVNISCAVDSAKKLGFAVVQLERGDFELSRPILISGYEGTIEGVTRAATRIRVVDGSIDCSATDGSNAALQFIQGRVRIALMSIEMTNPCSSGSNFSVFRFNSDPANCARRTVFADLDRVEISGSYERSFSVGITADAHPFCPRSQKLNGQLQINRSTIHGLYVGVFSSMGAGSQVDITFNEFYDNVRSVAQVDANQNTNIAGNSFEFGDGEGAFADGTAMAISLNTLSAPPNTNRTVIHKNDFTDHSNDNVTVGIGAFQDGPRQDHTISITANRFSSDNFLDGYGIVSRDINLGYVSGNVFTGRLYAATLIGSSSGKPSSRGWIFANNGYNRVLSLEADIWLTEDAEDCIVGPQSADVLNQGTNNLIEPTTNIVRSDLFGS